MNLILENVSDDLAKAIKAMAKIGEVAYKEYLESGKKATLASDLYKELGL